MNDEERQHQKINDLQNQWDLLSEKLSRLKHERILKNNYAEELRLEEEIKKIETERQDIEKLLSELESQTPQKTPEEELSEIHRQMFLANSDWELKKSLYTTEDFLAKHPNDPEAKLMKDKIERALSSNKASTNKASSSIEETTMPRLEIDFDDLPPKNLLKERKIGEGLFPRWKRTLSLSLSFIRGIIDIIIRIFR